MQGDLKTQIQAKAAEIAPRITEFRRHLHQHPELSLQEYKTAALVAEKLQAIGLTPRLWLDGRGVTATIEGTAPSQPAGPNGAGKAVGLRADMDALPIEELNAIPYKSAHTGVMHACGHDGHTANLLGTAEVLHSVRNAFAGKVQLVFQPAEEKGGGANLLIQAGLMDAIQVDAMFGFHGGPQYPVGEVAIRSGPTMAASDGYTITVTGRGGHAAAPHLCLNPISALVRIAAELEQIPATHIAANDLAIVTVASISAGLGATNVIPDSARLVGTYRTHDAGVRRRVGQEIQRTAERWQALGYQVEVQLKEGYPVVINAPELEPVVVRALQAQFPGRPIHRQENPTMGGEDFAYYGQKVPAYFMRLGVAPNPGLHNPKFNFNDAALENGMAAFARIAIEFLNGR